jgi:1-acyl-sn-glycerol-3-phosphate acyltransferase
MFRALFAYTLFLPWTLFVIVTGLPLSLMNPDYLHAYARLWGKVGLLFAGVSLVVEGRERIPKNRAVIYMANHQSNLDILALFAGLPGQFRWLAKEELFRVPLFGLAMRRSGYIPVDRSDRKRSIQSMAEAAERIHGGTSVVIFPEGTRSADGKLLPFKKGGFLLAMQAGATIVPVTIVGSGAITPKGTLRISRGPRTIRVHIGEPLETSGRLLTDRDELMEEVRRNIAAPLATP